MIKTNYLFFWQVVKEAFSKTKGYIGLFGPIYIFINYIYPIALIYFRGLIASMFTFHSFEVDELIVITNEIFYVTTFVTSLIKIILIIGLFKVTINYLNNQKFLLKNFLFSFYHITDTLFFITYFGLLFFAVNYLIGLPFMGVIFFLPPDISMFILTSGFTRELYNVFMLLFTIPVFIFVTHPQFSILKIIKRSYQLFCQKPLAILALYFITSLVWWVYSFYIVDFIDQFIIDFSRNFYHDPLFLYSAFYYLYEPIIKGVIMLFTLLNLLITYHKIDTHG